MCEANAFMAKDGQEERLLESVDMVAISAIATSSEPLNKRGIRFWYQITTPAV